MVVNRGKDTGRGARLAGRAVLAAVLTCAALSSNAFVQGTMNDEATLLAAGSLQAAMKKIGELFQTETGVGITASFGPSGNLRGEIENGR